MATPGEKLKGVLTNAIKTSVKNAIKAQTTAVEMQTKSLFKIPQSGNISDSTVYRDSSGIVKGTINIDGLKDDGNELKAELDGKLEMALQAEQYAVNLINEISEVTSQVLSDQLPELIVNALEEFVIDIVTPMLP